MAGAWQTITLLNGWSNSAGYTTARYRFESDGVTVRLAGTITGGTVTSGTPIFTLATAYTPSADRLMTVVNTNTVNGLLVAGSSVELVQIGSIAISNTYMSLECTFPLT